MGIITIIMVPTLLTLKVIIRINDAGHIFGFLLVIYLLDMSGEGTVQIFCPLKKKNLDCLLLWSF